MTSQEVSQCLWPVCVWGCTKYRGANLLPSRCWWTTTPIISSYWRGWWGQVGIVFQWYSIWSCLPLLRLKDDDKKISQIDLILGHPLAGFISLLLAGLPASSSQSPRLPEPVQRETERWLRESCPLWRWAQGHILGSGWLAACLPCPVSLVCEICSLRRSREMGDHYSWRAPGRHGSAPWQQIRAGNLYSNKLINAAMGWIWTFHTSEATRRTPFFRRTVEIAKTFAAFFLKKTKPNVKALHESFTRKKQASTSVPFQLISE